MRTPRSKSSEYKATAASLAKWGGAREKAVVALRAGWSIGAIARAYELPPHIVKYFRDDAGIPVVKAGGTRPTPNVGDLLT